MSQHFLVEVRLNVVCKWRKRKKVESLRNELKVKNLNKIAKEKEI